MADAESFEGLIDRVRAGDDHAAAELVRRYEPAIRRAVRVRLVDARLGRLLDSMDICQSVMASFFVRAALGQYELGTPDQLLKLLARMARNKLANQANAQRAGRRDIRRVTPGVEGIEVAAAGPGPASQVAANDILQEARRLLTPDERRILERREQGDEWSEIAEELGGNPEALRKRLARAVDRVAGQLGLDEPSHG